MLRFIGNLTEPCKIRGTDYTILSLLTIVMSFYILGWKITVPILCFNCVLNIVGKEVQQRKLIKELAYAKAAFHTALDELTEEGNK